MTYEVKIGNIKIGNNNRIAVQSMTNTQSADFFATLNQIENLKNAGCDLVRLAISNDDDLFSAKKLIEKCNVPLIADIQFDHKLAIKSSEIGFSKIRFNPGNVGGEKNIIKIVEACKYNNTVIRIGVNQGSLDKSIENNSSIVDDADKMVESALSSVKLLEKHGFYDIVLSVKSSSVKTSIKAYRKLNQSCQYPLHLGITESGGGDIALIKSSVGIGGLLIDNIGDTIRVSLSDDPINEVIAGKNILRAVGKDKDYCEVISCPTCSRCKYDLISVADEIRDYTKNIKKPLKVAVMGCVVNGPGEARDADFGVAGGEEKAIIFEKGEVIKTIPMSDIVSELKKKIDGVK